MHIAEETSRESEKRLRDIFGAVNDGILIIDPGEYRIVETNQKASELLGYDEEELIGMLIEKIHPKEMVQLKKTLSDVLRGQPVQTDEFSCLRKDKHRLPAEISFSAVQLNNKTCVMSMVRDITERHRAGEEIKSLAKFPAENPNPIMRITKDGEIIYANEGSSPLRKTWECKDDCFLPDELRDQISHIFKSGTSEEVEVICGEQIFSILFSPIADAGYVNVYASDITERKHAEEALRKALNEIEQLKNRLQAENIYLQQEIKIQHNFEEIIGAGKALKKSLRKVEQVASTDLQS